VSEKVKLSKDGSSIDFVQSDNIPTSLKKFRQSPEIEGFYRFIYENDLQKEAFEILDLIVAGRKAKKKDDRQQSKAKEAPKMMAGKSSAAAAAKAPVKVAAKMAVKTAPKPAAGKFAPGKKK
jgi:hypothetical protein